MAPNRSQLSPPAGLVGGLARLNHASKSIRYVRSLEGVALSPDGKIVAAGTSNTTVQLWDMPTSTPHGGPLTGHTDTVNGVAFSPDGRLLASTSDDHTVRLWDMPTGTPHGGPLTGHTSAVSGVGFSPDGRLLASTSYDHTMRLWEVPERYRGIQSAAR